MKVVNVMEIIGYTLTFISLFFVLIQVSLRRKSILYGIESGLKCYRCKSEINMPIICDTITGELDIHKKMCKACERDKAIKKITDRIKIEFDFTDKKWTDIAMTMSIIAVIFNFLNMILDGCIIIGGICIFTSQFILFLRYMSTTEKNN